MGYLSILSILLLLHVVKGGLLYSIGDPSLPQTCSPPPAPCAPPTADGRRLGHCAAAGRQLGHGAPAPVLNCTSLSPRMFGKYFKSLRHRHYGLQDWMDVNISAKMLLVDCVTYQCRSAPPPAAPPCPPMAPVAARRLGHEAAVTPAGCEARRRRSRHLGHGGSAPTVPAGWLPDDSLPLSTDFCNITTVITPALVQSEPHLAVFSYTWYVLCLVVPRSSAPLKTFADLGFVGILHLVPCVQLGCGPAVYLSIIAKLFDGNPIPALPVIIASSGYVGITEMILKNYESSEKNDEVSITTEMLKMLTTPGMTLHVEATDDKALYYDTANSAGYVFSYRLYGALHMLLLCASIYLTKKQGSCSWSTYVLVLEGVVGSSLRGFRCFVGPFFYNGGGVGTTIDWGN